MALPNQQIVESYKIAIVGDGGTGKTTFVTRHVDGNRNKFVDPSGVTVHPIAFNTNLGRICFNCWDTTGLSHDRAINWREIDLWEKELRRALDGAEGAIIMFDVTQRSTYDHVPKLIYDINRVCGNIPIVLCGNKVDLQDRNVNARDLAGWLDGSIKYCEISALSNYNFERPFLLLALVLVRRDESIWFRNEPLVLPKFEIDTEAQRRNESEFDGAVYQAHRDAFRIRLLIPHLKRFLNRRRNRDPNSPLPDHDVELMMMVELEISRKYI